MIPATVSSFTCSDTSANDPHPFVTKRPVPFEPFEPSAPTALPLTLPSDHPIMRAAAHLLEQHPERVEHPDESSTPKPQESSVCLAMIVRDDQDTIQACIDSARRVVERYCIIDTGSTDDTRKIARRALKGVKGTIVSRPWVNFAVNRTELLELARRQKTDYVLMLDGDHHIEVTGYPPAFTADSYLLPVRSGSLDWRLPLLTRAEHPFRYEGAAHAYLTSDTPAITEESNWLTVHGGGGATVAKLERDREALEAALLTNPADPRTVFYLARTYDDLDEPGKAIHYYRVRAQMNGWEQERFYARYRLGCLLAEHVSFDQGAAELLEAWRLQPDRIEPLRALANSANHVADKAPVPDGLFVHRNAYREEAA